MARHGRYFLPDQSLHVIQRGNNCSAIFFDIEDYEHYRDWLAGAAVEYGCLIHAYVLMTNHVHLLSLPRVPRACRAPCNRSTGAMCARSTPPAGGAGPYGRGAIGRRRSIARPTSCCCRYIELNPVRARMVAHPADYRWSSYRAHADGAADALVSDHPLYHALGRGVAERRTAYQGLFQTALEPGFVDALRAATNGGWALGGASFERRIHRRAPPARYAAPERPTAPGTWRQTAA